MNRAEKIIFFACVGTAIGLGLTGVACVADHCLWQVPTFLKGGFNEEKDQQTESAFGWALVVLGLAMGVPALVVLVSRKHDAKWVLWFLYLERFLTAWGDRMWQMAVPILFIDMFKDTLLPMSLYAMIVYIAVVQFLPRLGSWVDHSSRLVVQQVSLGVENVCVLLACIIICAVTAKSQLAFEVNGKHSLEDWQTQLWFAIVVLLGCIGELFNNTLVVSMEKDWVVVIAEESGTPLSRLNTWMRRIDLFCKALSPVAFTALYQLHGEQTQRRIFYGSITVGLWNLLSCPLEIILVRAVYDAFLSLAYKTHVHEDGTRHSHELGHKTHYHLLETSPEDSRIRSELIIPAQAIRDSSKQIDTSLCVMTRHKETTAEPTSMEGIDQLALESGEGSPRLEAQVGGCYTLQESQRLIGLQKEPPAKCSLCSTFFQSFRVYIAQPVFLASFAYTMLYMTVLDNGALMTSYLEWANVDPLFYGIGRGAGAIMGLAGTFAYPFLVEKVCKTIAKTGLVSLWVFFLHLAPIGVLVFVSGGAGNAVEYAMVICVALSRAWLWIFDLAITELVQISVPEQDRGIFGAAQTASYQLFFILVHVAGVLSPDPENYSWLVLGSLVVVLTASVLYTMWYVRSP